MLGLLRVGQFPRGQGRWLGSRSRSNSDCLEAHPRQSVTVITHTRVGQDAVVFIDGRPTSVVVFDYCVFIVHSAVLTSLLIVVRGPVGCTLPGGSLSVSTSNSHHER
jgi:hypothetical protein